MNIYRHPFVWLTVALFSLAAPLSVSAATLYVNSATGNDSLGDGSLLLPYASFHKGYTSASANDTLDLTGTFSWSDAAESGDTTTTGYTLGKNLTVLGHGPSSTIIQAATTANTATRRVFTVSSGVTVTLQDLTVRYGKVGAVYGGGIANSGTLNVYGCAITSNISQDGGGGISNLNLLNIASSTVSYNLATGSAAMGAGLLNDFNIVSGGYMTVTNTTVAYNSISNATTGYTDGGGIHFRKGSGTITNSTIAYNTAFGIGGVGMDDSAATLTIKNNIIANNFKLNTANSQVDFGFRSSGQGNVVDNGYNIIGVSQQYTVSGTGDWKDQSRTGTFTKVGTATTGAIYLESVLGRNDLTNGLLTLALLPSSIAIDNADTAANGATTTPPLLDQRGAARSGTLDIGAFERNGSGLTISLPTVQSSAITFSSVQYDRMTLSWTAGNGSRMIVFVTAGSTGVASPLGIGYATSSVFGLGAEVLGTGWYAIYDGLGTTTTVTGLTQGTTYRFQVFDYNGLTEGAQLYLADLGSGNPANQQTHAVATVYVNSSSGNDTTGDGTSGAPYASFHKGYTMTQAGDTLDLTGTFTWTDAAETGDAATTGYTIGRDYTIVGRGADATIIQAATASTTGDRRVFTISQGYTVTIKNVEIRHGRNTTSYGGGIYNSGNLTVDACRIDNNSASSGGAGIDNVYRLTVASSTVDHNTSTGSTGMGGGLLNDFTLISGGYMTVNNSTISHNVVSATVAYTEGGGIHFRTGSGTITNSTIAYNTAAGVGGVGIDDSAGVITLKNNIIANNIKASSASYVDFGYRSSGQGNVVDNGYNIIGTSQSYSFTATGDWTDANRDGIFVLQTAGTTGQVFLNSSLAANNTLKGTQTLAFTASNSIAVNNGSTGSNGATSTVPTLDQRGASRNGSTDIGAYEYNGGDITDTTVPTVSILTPTASAVVSGASYVLTASSTDDISVSGVKFYVNGTLVGSEDTSIPYSVSWDTTATSSGAKSVVAVARDAAGNVATSTAISFTVDNTVPTVSLTAPANAANVGGASVTLSADASDDVSVAGVKFYINGGLQGSEDTATPFSITWNTTATTSGSKTIVAVARDSANNYATSSSITVTVDNTAPTASSLSPADNATGVSTTTAIVLHFSENIVAVSGKNIVIKKTSDNSTVETIATNDTSKVAISTTHATTTLAAALLPSTSYYVNVDSGAFTDAAANAYAGISNTTTWNFTTASDGFSPSATVTVPTSGATVGGAAITLSATASDDIGVAGVKFYVNGVLQGSEDTSSPFAIIWDSTATSTGSKTVVAVARDAANNYGTSTAVAFTLDNTGPVISSISSGTPGPTSATVTWTTNENSDSQINYGANSSYGATTTLASSMVTSHSHAITGLSSNTTYHFRVRSTDAYGNLSVSTDQTFTTATSDSVAPSVTLTLPTNGVSISGSAIGMAATASDNVGVVGVKFYVNGFLVGSEDTTSPYTQIWNSAATSSGSRVVFAVARDAAGNYATSSVATVTLNNYPTPTSIAASTATTSARVTWQTPLAGSSKIYFGVVSASGSSTPESNADSKVTDHSLDVSGLPACTVYKYMTVSKNDASEAATSTESSFTTAGCSGGASVLSNSQGSITAAAGGTLTEGALTLVVPPSFTGTTSTATFQANKLDGATFFGSVAPPTGKNAVGTTVFNLKALTDESSTLTTFSEPLTVSLSYDDADVVGLDESNLKIHRYDDSTWTALENCSVNTSTNVITCETEHFSDFAIFGDESSSTSSSSSGSVGGGGGISGFIGTTQTYKGPGYKAPRPQIIYPDGRIVYLDVASSTAAAQQASVSNAVSVAASSGSGTYQFTRTLRARSEGSDVKELQKFLNAQGFIVAKKGLGSLGNESNVFGPATYNALVKFQEAHAKEILSPYGLKKGTGIFGSSTRAVINALVGKK